METYLRNQVDQYNNGIFKNIIHSDTKTKRTKQKELTQGWAFVQNRFFTSFPDKKQEKKRKKKRVRDLRTEEAGMQSRLIKMDKEIANKKQYLEKLNDDFKEREAGLDQLSGATIKKFQALQDKV